MKAGACIELAGLSVRAGLVLPEGAQGPGIMSEEEIREQGSGPLITLMPEDLPGKAWFAVPDTADDAVQITRVLLAVSQKLLPYGRCVMHGAAISWKGKGYIFTGPSGVGKTTQYRNWRRMFGDEVRIINGDKPVLCRDPEGSFSAHPSPWRGKEHYGSSTLSAPLEGIICLEQAQENRVRRLAPSEALLPVMYQLFRSPKTLEDIRHFVTFTRSLLERVPVWELCCRPDAEAVRMLAEALSEQAPGELWLNAERDIGTQEIPEAFGEQNRTEKRYEVRKDVMLSELFGRYFLFSAESAWKICPQLRELNREGAFCWSLLKKGMNVPQMTETVVSAYGIEEEEAGEGVESFLQQLTEQGFIRVMDHSAE